MKKTFLLFSTSLMSLAITAQDSTSTSAPEKKAPLEISGSVDAYFRQNITTSNFVSDTVTSGLAPGATLAPSSSFAGSPGFAIGMANIIVKKEGEKVGAVADLVFGPRGAAAVFNSGGSSSIVNQLYAYWNVHDKVKLTIGNFNTFLGYEVISPVDNFNYSTSYAFSYGPFSHTGLKADIALTDNFSAMLAILNATDMTNFNPVNQYSFGAQIGYENDKGGAWINVLAGDQDGRNKINKDTVLAGDAKSMIQVDLTTGWNLTDALYLGLNATMNSMPMNDTVSAAAALADTDLTEGDQIATPSFSSVGLYAQYAFSDAFALGLRGEYFGEANNGPYGSGAIGTYTDGAASIIDVTLSAKINKGPLSIIPEIRLDSASEDIFLDSDNKPSSTLTSFVLAAVYTF